MSSFTQEQQNTNEDYDDWPLKPSFIHWLYFILHLMFEGKTISADFELMHPWQEKCPGRENGGEKGK